MTARTVETYRQAAAVVGLTARTVRDWVRAGHLPPPPWTERRLLKVAGERRGGGPRQSAPHGTVTRWRGGCGCDRCLDAHNRASREWRREARTEWWAGRAGPLLETLASGVPYWQALEMHEVSPQAVRGFRSTSKAFAEAMDDALMEGRDPALKHGSPSAWKARCRCPECREYHEGTR